jgi:hypothetical protein
MTALFPLAPFSTPQRITAPQTPGDWSASLDPGEIVLWQGRPATGFHIRARHVATSIVGLIFTPLALWIAIGARNAGTDAPPALVTGVIAFFILAGLWMVAGPHVLDMLKRRGTHYALTDRRGLVDTDFLGRVSFAIEIGPDNPVWMAKTTPGSVFFAQLAPPPGMFGAVGGPSRRSAPRIIGFELIPDAERVYALTLDMQARQRPDEAPDAV